MVEKSDPPDRAIAASALDGGRARRWGGGDFRYHRGSVAFEDDRARDLELRARGFAVRRFTGNQLDDEPERVAADLAATLGLR